MCIALCEAVLKPPISGSVVQCCEVLYKVVLTRYQYQGKKLKDTKVPCLSPNSKISFGSFTDSDSVWLDLAFNGVGYWFLHLDVFAYFVFYKY